MSNGANGSQTPPETPQSGGGVRGIDTLQKLVSVIAIVVAGLWSCFLYVKFDGMKRSLELASASLEKKLSEIGVETAAMRLQTEKRPHLTVQQHINTMRLQDHEDNGSRVYLISHVYEIKNEGSTTHEVTYSLVKAYAVSVPSDLDLGAIELRCFDDLPSVSWRLIATRGNYYGPQWTKGMTIKDKAMGSIPLLKGGGGTAELDPGESSEGTMHILIECRKGNVIGFETRLGIDGGREASNRWRLTGFTVVNGSEPRSEVSLSHSFNGNNDSAEPMTDGGHQ